jgi:hypothetical protein
MTSVVELLISKRTFGLGLLLFFVFERTFDVILILVFWISKTFGFGHL